MYFYSSLLLCIFLFIPDIKPRENGHWPYNFLDYFNLTSFGNREIIIYSFDGITLSEECRHTLEIQNREISVISDANQYHLSRVSRLRGNTSSIIFIYANNTSQLETFISSETNVSIVGIILWAPSYFFLWPEPFQSESKVIESLTSLCKKHNARLRSNYYFVFEAKNEFRKILVWEYYNIRNESIVRSIDVQNGRINVDILEHKLLRRKDLKRTVMKAVGVNNPFDMNEVTFKNRTKDTDPIEFEGGMSVKILKDLAESLNFTIHAKSAELAEGQNDNNENEIDRIISSREADISITTTTVRSTLERRLLCTFLQPTYSDRIKAFYRPPSASLIHDIFLTSFSWGTWIAMLSTWALIVILVKIFVWVKVKVSDVGKMDSEVGEESVLWGVGAACQQGWHIQPESTSIKTIFVVGYLMGFACFVAFSAVIVSASIDSNVIKDFMGLVQSSYKLVIDEDNNGLHSSMAVLENLGLGKSDFSILEDTQDCIKCVMSKPKCAYLSSTDEFHLMARLHMNESVQCDSLLSVPVGVVSLTYSMLVQRHSPFTKFFNWRIIKLMEIGLVHRYSSEYQKSTRTQCEDSRKYKEKPFGINDVFTAYIILFSGSILSLTFVLLERLNAWFSKSIDTNK